LALGLLLLLVLHLGVSLLFSLLGDLLVLLLLELLGQGDGGVKFFLLLCWGELVLLT